HGGRPRDRPRPRQGPCSRPRRGGLARRSPPPQRAPALRSRAGGERLQMVTRASFPVLREFAYLNAGSVGPLATETVEAMRAEEERSLVLGRGSHASFLRLLEARERARALLETLDHVEAEQVALTASTSDGCQV